VESRGKESSELGLSRSASANFAFDFRKKAQELTQKMRITKEILQN
jgi:hypothetical protein